MLYVIGTLLIIIWLILLVSLLKHTFLLAVKYFKSRKVHTIPKEKSSAPRMRAQVMCSGTKDYVKMKYEYQSINDCYAASLLFGGDKLCIHGCLGLGSCVSACKSNAITIINQIAAVDYNKCQGCGECISACPKTLITLIPFDAKYWVGCKCTEKVTLTKSQCEVGCTGCKICEKNCPTNAIRVKDNLARIDYSLCSSCGKCYEECPRKIIWSSVNQVAVKKDNTVG